MKRYYPTIITLLLLLSYLPKSEATDYYFHTTLGNDQNNGTSMDSPFRSLQQIDALQLLPGDQILLAAGQEFEGMVKLVGVRGTNNAPIIIRTLAWEGA